MAASRSDALVVKFDRTVAFELNETSARRVDAAASGGGDGGEEEQQERKTPPVVGQHAPSKPAQPECNVHCSRVRKRPYRSRIACSSAFISVCRPATRFDAWTTTMTSASVVHSAGLVLAPSHTSLAMLPPVELTVSSSSSAVSRMLCARWKKARSESQPVANPSGQTVIARKKLWCVPGPGPDRGGHHSQVAAFSFLHGILSQLTC